MKTLYPNYRNSLVNVSNSILNYYGVKTHHPTLPEVDKYLEKDYKNVVLLLYDGFGSNLMGRHLSPEDFLNKHKIKDITSVFPATTTAATTTVITGLTPAEHCWLGWDIYVKSIDKTITMFWNVIKNTDIKVADYSVAKQEFPYTTIFDKINETKNAKAYCVSPYDDGVYYAADNPDEMYEKIIELCNTDEKKFIYVYHAEPDHLMHDLGTDDQKIIELMKTINRKAENLSNQLDDTLLIITADHGHMSVKDYFILEDYPSLSNMLLRETSLESRATNFFVKENMLKNFKKEFNKLLGNDFILLSKKEVLEKELFGTGTPNEKFESCLGDYIAIAISNKAIDDIHEANPLKGLHAGITEDEVLIPLIIVEK